MVADSNTCPNSEGKNKCKIRSTSIIFSSQVIEFIRTLDTRSLIMYLIAKNEIAEMQITEFQRCTY